MITNGKIRILSVDDHPIVTEGLMALINDQPDMEIVGEAANANAALEQFRLHQPDVTLMDLRLAHENGVDAMLMIRAEFPQARVIILTMFEGDVEIARALKAGANAYALKSMSSKSLLDTIRKVYAGKKPVSPEIARHIAEHLGEETLTPRELEVLGLIVDGNRSRDIGEKLFISEETVKVHVKNIREKLGATDRAEAVAIAIRRGIIQL